MAVLFSKSLGPISILIGMPFNSHSLYFHPGDTSSLVSRIGLNLARSFFICCAAFRTLDFVLSNSVGSILVLYSFGRGKSTACSFI